MRCSARPLESVRIGGHFLWRNADGTWPSDPAVLAERDDVRLETIGLAFAVREAYRGTAYC